MKHVLTTLAMMAASCSVSLPMRAAVVTWGAATNINGDGDVSTTGTLIRAFRFVEDGVVTGATVNGVNFEAFQITGLSNTVGDFNLSAGSFFPVADTSSVSAPYASLSADYQTLLSRAAASGTPMFLTMSNLTVGQAYQVQFWVSDSNPPVPPLIVIDQKVLDANSTDAAGGLGQFLVGTFTADSTSQQFVAFGQPDALLNAFQLRSVDTPEPTSMLTFGAMFGMSGIILRWRRRSTRAHDAA
jgi:hypothetical protein